MRHVKIHADKVDELRNVGKVKLKNLKEFLQFELDRREEVLEEEDYLNFSIPVNFDVDKVFGLDVCSSDNDDYVNLYLNWYPAFDKKPADRIHLFMVYCNNSIPGDDFDLDIKLKQYHRIMIARRLNKEFEAKYGKSLRKYWKEKIDDEK